MKPPSEARLVIRSTRNDIAWLKALAKANDLSVNDLMGFAITAICDYAGRRTGSWEADTARSLLQGSGIEKRIDYKVLETLCQQEAEENIRHSEWWKSLTPEQKADHYGYKGQPRADFIASLKRHQQPQ